MNDLYSLSQIIKRHPSYKIQRDNIHHLYRYLGLQKKLNAEEILSALKQNHLELFADIQKSHDLFKTYCEESVRLKLSGVNLLCYGEELYPLDCYWMSDPPLTLSYLGSPAWLNGSTLAVVGSREPTFESVQWMEKEFTTFCEKAHPCVISGGARGVDQKSHSIALRQHKTTVVVLPSGLGSLYPESLKDWVGPILDQGGSFLSEYSYEQKMHKHLFHHRNRLIAALGKATLLIEARRRSGTLITAQQALLLGRPVWVVPGHPLDSHFGGSLDLLSDGASLIRDAEDLLMYFSAERRGLGLPENTHHYL